MRFTVVGCSGFIGSEIVKKLRSEQYECYLPERNDQRLYDKDLGHVIYCAGKVANYMQDPFDTVQAHVVVLANILKRKNFDRLVYLSSTRLYDNLHGMYSHSLVEESVGEDKILELNPSCPRHLYDISKALGESLCFNMALGKSSIVRLSCVYGFRSNGFINDVIKSAVNNKEIKINSSPYYERDYVLIDDVVNTLVSIAVFGKGPIYNLASGENVKNKDIFIKICELTGCKIYTSSCKEANPLPKINISLIKSEFGFHPKYILDELPNIVMNYKNIF